MTVPSQIVIDTNVLIAGLRSTRAKSEAPTMLAAICDASVKERIPRALLFDAVDVDKE